MEFDKAFEHVCVPMYLVSWYKCLESNRCISKIYKCTGTSRDDRFVLRSILNFDSLEFV
jgi:hypothetical protein